MTGTTHSWLGFMPLRGGSRGIPNKNITLLAGRPLFVWSLEQAVLAGIFDHIVVATDSPEIRRLVEQHIGPAVQVVDRSAANADDKATTESVMLEVRERFRFDVIGLVQATSPLLMASDLRRAKKQFVNEQLDSLLSAAVSKRFFWSRDGRALNYDPAARPRRQDFAGTLVENGAFYFTRDEILRRLGSRLGGVIGIAEMAPETVLEIDEPADLLVAEQLLSARGVAVSGTNHQLSTRRART